MSTPATAVMIAAMMRTSQIEMWKPADALRHADRAELEVDRGEVRRGEPGRRVGADRVERDIAEIEQARVADDHVEADRHHREDDDRDHRVHVREGLEDRNLEQDVRSVELVRPQDRVGDGNPEHRQRERDAPNSRRHQIQDVHDREQSEHRRVRRYPRRPRQQEHERGDHDRRQCPLQQRRLRLPASAGVLDADGLERAPEAPLHAIRH